MRTRQARRLYVPCMNMISCAVGEMEDEWAVCVHFLAPVCVRWRAAVAVAGTHWVRGKSHRGAVLQDLQPKHEEASTRSVGCVL